MNGRILNLQYLPEPNLHFQYGQKTDDPRVGLTLFGPFKKATTITIGLIGTQHCTTLFKTWLKTLRAPISGDATAKWPLFPGFLAAYGTELVLDPLVELTVDAASLGAVARISDAKTRVYKTVSLFADAIIEAAKREESRPQVWIVVIPEFVYRYCRPRSVVPFEERIYVNRIVRKSVFGADDAELPFGDISMKDEYVEEDEPWEDTPDLDEFDVHFRNQLKARLLPHKLTSQVIRDSTLDPNLYLNARGKPFRRTEPKSAIGWNLSNGIFYKGSGKPWKLGVVRQDVCYLGLVFKKRTESSREMRAVCCGAQMFLDSGEGFVFRGSDGQWHSEKSRSFHLNKPAAADLMDIALNEYKRIRGTFPKEVFVHGRAAFNDEEWNGFLSSTRDGTKLTGVRIKKTNALKLYTGHKSTVLRGTWFREAERRAWLWTHGHIPRIESYPGFRVPSPILIDVIRGEAALETVIADIQALTKLNYNACRYSDSLPITLKFANAVGEVLTAAPESATRNRPQPFMYYI